MAWVHHRRDQFHTWLETGMSIRSRRDIQEEGNCPMLIRWKNRTTAKKNKKMKRKERRIRDQCPSPTHSRFPIVGGMDHPPSMVVVPWRWETTPPIASYPYPRNHTPTPAAFPLEDTPNGHIHTPNPARWADDSFQVQPHLCACVGGWVSSSEDRMRHNPTRHERSSDSFVDRCASHGTKKEKKRGENSHGVKHRFKSTGRIVTVQLHVWTDTS